MLLSSSPSQAGTGHFCALILADFHSTPVLPFVNKGWSPERLNRWPEVTQPVDLNPGLPALLHQKEEAKEEEKAEEGDG